MQVVAISGPACSGLGPWVQRKIERGQEAAEGRGKVDPWEGPGVLAARTGPLVHWNYDGGCRSAGPGNDTSIFHGRC